MYEIDRHKFGSFVAALRREKGCTQKELAAKLYISDKAISKWETGVSIPDVALLVPLAEVLGVSVTELLNCQRMEKEETMDAGQVEDLVKKAITYSEESPGSQRAIRKKNILIYAACALAACCEVAAMFFLGYTTEQFSESVQTVLLLCGILGFYMMILVKEQLPAYYDENKITTYNDGPVRMNLGVIRLSNRNWPHILKIFRCWIMSMLVGYPALSIALNQLSPQLWIAYEKIILLLLILGGLLAPLVYVGKKYQ